MSNDSSPSPFTHWMLKEIYEQAGTLADTIQHYVRDASFIPGTNNAAREWLTQAKGDIVIAASGSSRHAGMVAEILIEDLSGISVDVEYASEYCYRSEKSIKNASVMVISQSGETADTLAALRKATACGHRTLAVTNVPTSTMASEANVSYPTLAGRERAIPATKSFTGQLAVLYVLALLAAEVRGDMSAEAIKSSLKQLESLPELLETCLPIWEVESRKVAQSFRNFKNFLFLGRGLHYPIAREGALKLKESSYLHAEGYPSGELKHGPNAIVNDTTPLVMIATVDRADAESVLRYEKVVSLMRDMRQQGAKILCVANQGDTTASKIAHHTLFVPVLNERLLPLVEVVPFQFLSYFMAIEADIDVDRPRNLSKAVTLE